MKSSHNIRITAIKRVKLYSFSQSNEPNINDYEKHKLFFVKRYEKKYK